MSEKKPEKEIVKMLQQFGSNIKKLRELKCLSIAVLAKKSKLTEECLMMIETGTWIDLDIITSFRICEALDTRLDLMHRTHPVGRDPGYDFTKIMDLDLSVRTINCLRFLDIETIGDLKNTDRSLLLGSRNFGKRSMKEIEELLFFYS